SLSRQHTTGCVSCISVFEISITRRSVPPGSRLGTTCITFSRRLTAVERGASCRGRANGGRMIRRYLASAVPASEGQRPLSSTLPANESPSRQPLVRSRPDFFAPSIATNRGTVGDREGAVAERLRHEDAVSHRIVRSAEQQPPAGGVRQIE